jgi:splicing factor 3B subunit 4
VNVYIPKDKLTNLHQGYGFVEFATEEDAEYAIKIMNMIKLYGKPLRVNKAKRDGKTVDVGANLFIGNLDAEVDEKLLYDTFSAFGVIITTPKVPALPGIPLVIVFNAGLAWAQHSRGVRTSV